MAAPAQIAMHCGVTRVKNIVRGIAIIVDANAISTNQRYLKKISRQGESMRSAKAN